MQKSGFSLLELLLSVSIISILLMFVSSFVQKYQQVELESFARDIHSAVRFAKFSAVISGESLAVECLESGVCTKGLRVITDKPRGKSVLLREWRWPHNRQQIIWQGFQAKSGPKFAADIRHNAANGKFIITRGDKVFIELIVNRLGKVRFKHYD